LFAFINVVVIVIISLADSWFTNSEVNYMCTVLAGRCFWASTAAIDYCLLAHRYRTQWLR